MRYVAVMFLRVSRNPLQKLYSPGGLRVVANATRGRPTVVRPRPPEEEEKEEARRDQSAGRRPKAVQLDRLLAVYARLREEHGSSLPDVRDDDVLRTLSDLVDQNALEKLLVWTTWRTLGSCACWTRGRPTTSRLS